MLRYLPAVLLIATAVAIWWLNATAKPKVTKVGNTAIEQWQVVMVPFFDRIPGYHEKRDAGRLSWQVLGGLGCVVFAFTLFGHLREGSRQPVRRGRREEADDDGEDEAPARPTRPAQRPTTQRPTTQRPATRPQASSATATRSPRPAPTSRPAQRG